MISPSSSGSIFDQEPSNSASTSSSLPLLLKFASVCAVSRVLNSLNDLDSAKERLLILRERNDLLRQQQTTLHIQAPPNPQKSIHEITGKMTQLCRKIVHVNLRWIILGKVSILRQFFRFIWDRILSCSMGRPSRYRRLSRRNSSPAVEAMEMGSGHDDPTTTGSGCDSDSDLVALKISILGDCQIGKTSFVIKYVGDEQEKRCLEMKGLNLMDKTLVVRGARIAFRIWDVGGDNRSLDQVPIACKDAVAILFMFDLTSRCTLNSVIGWYNQARKWNQTAIPILIGTKFDDFVQLPPDLQWTIVTQARAYAKAMKATLFFSSSTHNINVNKIFKFIMAKLFNLPWTVQRNLTLGEPIIDF